MGQKKQGFIFSVMFLVMFYAVVYSQKIEIVFDADVREKIYDGTDSGRIMGAVRFFRISAEGDSIKEGSNLKIYNEQEQKEGDYEVVGVVFDDVNAGACSAAVTVKLLDTDEAEKYEFQDSDDAEGRIKTVKFNGIINKAKAYVKISCNSIELGETPRPVIDTLNYVEKLKWNDSLWLKDNVKFRYAQMNMDLADPNEPDELPAWRKEAPQTRGKYWVQAMVSGNGNYNPDTSLVAMFTISDPTPIRNVSVKRAAFGLSAQNPTSDTARLFLSLPETCDGELFIFDNQGNVVYNYEFDSKDASDIRYLSWDLRNQNGRKVASGSYLALVRAKGLKTSKVYSYKSLIAVKNN
jgi:hypothetical protein